MVELNITCDGLKLNNLDEIEWKDS